MPEPGAQDRDDDDLSASAARRVARAASRPRRARRQVAHRLVGEDRRGLAERAGGSSPRGARGRAARRGGAASERMVDDEGVIGHEVRTPYRPARLGPDASPGATSSSRRATRTRRRRSRQRWRAGAADHGVLAPARHLLPRPRGPAEAARGGPGEAELIAYPRAGRGRRARERLHARRVPDPRRRCAPRSTHRSARSSMVDKRRHLLLVAGACASTSTTSTASGRGSSSRRVAPPGSDLRAEHAQVAELRAALGLGDDRIVPEGLRGRCCSRGRAGAELLAARPRGDGPRLRAVLALPRGRRAARRGRAACTPAPTSRTPPTPRVSCAETSAIGALVAAGGTRDPRGRGHGRRPSSSPRAAAAASAWRVLRARTRGPPLRARGRPRAR